MANNKSYLLTIFTPTYNRAKLLPRLWESIKRQDDRDRLVWLVVDDGSTDNTKELIASLASKSDFAIRYMPGNGRGKHDAFNIAIEAADSDLFFCVDSDDWMAEDAVKSIEKIWDSIKSDRRLGGFAGATLLSDGSPLNVPYPVDGFRCDTIRIKDRYRINDVPEVYRTDVLKNYRFPVLRNERFVTEAYVFDELTLDHPLRYYNRVLMGKDYLKTGLTSKSYEIRKNSPCGTLNYYARRFAMTRDPLFKLKAAINFFRFSRFAPKEAKWLMQNGARMDPRLVIVEPVMDGRQHESINAAIVLASAQVLHSGNTGKRYHLTLVCDPGHEAVLREIWALHGIEVPGYEFVPFASNGRRAELRRFLLPARLGLKAEDRCIITFQNPSIVIGTMLSRCRNFWVAEHGFLSSFGESPNAVKGKLQRSIKNLLKILVFFILGYKCRYLLFGSSIFERASQLLPKWKKRFIDFPLPYLFYPARANTETTDNFGGPVRVSQMIGAHAMISTSPLFAAEALLLKEGKNERAHFRLHGVFKNPNFIMPINSKVEISYKAGLEDAATRDAIMKDSDYLVYAPPPENYRLMASGAIFDALSFCVPVIALKNDYFEWLNREVGPIGILVDSAEEIPNAIAEAVVGFNSEAHQKTCRLMAARREKLGTAGTAERIRSFL